MGRSGSETRLFGNTADYLNAHAIAGESVLLEPAGVIGWRCRSLRVLDDVGLVTPRASESRRRGPGCHADLLEATRPDWLVIRAGLLRGGSAFAGATAPFTDIDQRRRLLAPHEFVSRGDSTAGEQALVAFHRWTEY